MNARVQRAQPWLGTLVEIAVEGPDAVHLNAAIERAFARIAAIHGAMSFHDARSELSRVNRHAARDWVALSGDLARVFGAALDFAAASDGLFDPSVAPWLVETGHLPCHPDMPAAATPGWQAVEFDGDRVRFALLWLSGALWLAFHYFLRVDGEFGPEPHPLEAWWLRLHGLMAMLALALAGSLAPNHIGLAWNRRRNLRSGLPMLALTVWLAATGYALYYFSSDDNAAWLPLLHWIAGLALPLLLGLHIRLGRRSALPRVNQPQHLQQRHAVAPSYNPPARIKASS